ncbi:uncharacterized protein BHQ10_008132 [Talaromyces amestolkiae]|uniref:FCP1 homology domain-containing protein n=1 Tax=Talaromyces amestolkiae TaxID=1196081 RepID=A0A364L8H8_TALAM|nr:uncharacterized protein BHQ10_008132 [Talaromyces amestolkiae]RAO72120.1 hypothetical protein BHQ10_008132 [Talaromyces amestolkiae]
MRDSQRTIHSLPMAEEIKDVAQSTLPDGHRAIPSFHGGMTYESAENAQSKKVTGQGQWSSSQQSRRSQRIQQPTEQNTWNNNQQTVYNTSHQMAYSTNNSSAAYSFAPYNNMSNTTLNPYMANTGTIPQNPINNTSNFGWGAIYATSTTSHQTPTAPVMQPLWLQMQSAQQMMMPQPTIGGFGSGQSFFTNSNGMHRQQIRHMSTETSPAKGRYEYISGLRRKMYHCLPAKYKTDEFLEPVQRPLPIEDSDLESVHPITQIRRDVWLAVPERYKTDELQRLFNSARLNSSQDGNSVKSTSLQKETHRLLYLVRAARIRECENLPKEEKYRPTHPESNSLETMEKRQYVRATSQPPVPLPSILGAANSRNEGSSASGNIKYVHTKVEPPMTPLPLKSYLEQAAKEPIDLQFTQPLLVILDLNGTLLYRRRKVFPPKFTRRPALNYFLERLTTRHEVMVWSSSRPDTVDAICNEIFSTGQKEKLVARWSRDHLDLNKEQFNSKVQVYKVLEKVWADKDIQAKFPTKKDLSGKAAFNAIRYTPGLDKETEMTGFLNKRWDQSNTVLIDDSTLKAAANPYNIIQVPEFTNVPNENDTTVLKELLLKIRVLAKSNDVSRRLRSLGSEGIQIRREEVLASVSESESEAQHIKQQEKIDEGNGEKVVGSTEVFETDNKIVPISLPPQPTSGSGSKRARAKAEKAARKAKKKQVKKQALPDASREVEGGPSTL